MKGRGAIVEPESYYRAAPSGRPEACMPSGVSEAEVCVIGGGFAGLNTVLGLAERGLRDVALVEASDVGFGASGRNGGFVFAGFSRGEDLLHAELGGQHARRLYRGTLDAVELVRQRIGQYAIDCDACFDGVLWANWFSDSAVLRTRQQLLSEHFETPWEWIPKGALRELLRTSRYHDALFEPRAFHFHPLKYARGLAVAAEAAGVRVYERAPVIGLDRTASTWRVRTPQGEVHAKQVVLACGGYLAGLRRKADAGVLPIATYVMVTEPLGHRLHDVMRTRAAVYDTRFAFDYYRPLPDTRLLWGGRISVLDRSAAAVRRLLYRDMLKVFPQLEGTRIDYAWSGLMSYARHQMPQIGQIEPGLWIAQAFGGHGVAPTTLAGERIAAAIAEGNNGWREFQPYGLVSAMKPAGFVGAQLSYWWAGLKDAWKAGAESRAR